MVLDEPDRPVLTVGKLNVLPNGANVIPNQVTFTVDIRLPIAILSSASQKIEQLVADKKYPASLSVPRARRGAGRDVSGYPNLLICAKTGSALPENGQRCRS